MPIHRRLLLLLCAVALAACQAQSPPPSGAGDGGPGAPEPGAEGPSGFWPADPGDAAPGQAPGAGGEAGQAGGTQDAPDDLAPLGGMCRDYLRARRVVVEIDWTAGAEPAAAAREHLLATLRSVTGGDVTQAGGGEVSASREVWSADDLRAVAATSRSQHSSVDQAALYVLSVRGRFEDEGALGVAYRASEMAMFPDRIGGLAALVGGRTAVERAVLVHEAGHLLCLVNIGFSSPFDREDAEHPKHSSDRASVMHWAIDTSAVGQLFNGPPPDSFTAQDLADLEGLESGRL